MGRVRKRLRTLLGGGKRKASVVPVADKFAHFRTIGTANNTFLENLARLVERGEGPPAGGMEAVAAAYESLAGPVGAMVKSLLAMTGGRYQSLARRYEELDRDLTREVFKSRPIEYGPLVLWPDEHEELHPEEVGPKAARLIEVMRRAGYPVPPFFCVSTYAYRRFMEATGLQDMVDEMLWSVDLNDPAMLRMVSGDVRHAVLEAQVPEGLAEEMLAAVRRLLAAGPSRYGVAVRSSAVVEDTESSFAGQFESILNVGEDGFLEAYKRVIASKYRLEALQYAVARGFLDQDVAMPVLVMAMVQPRAAGVAYSRDLERPDCAVVTAVPGLAQPVVEGEVIPDRYVVGMSHFPRIVDSRVASRETSLYCADGTGLVERRDDSDEPAMEAQRVVQVARMAWALEQHFGEPQDVEWAIEEGGRPLVLQTRTLRRLTSAPAAPRAAGPVGGYRVLLRDALRASAGVACGTVFKPADVAALAAMPDGVVLVVPTTSPALAGVMGRVRAVVAAAGSATGHMATVAREFGVPCLVGGPEVLAQLADGATVTVDSWNGYVYEGEVREILGGARKAALPAARDPVRESLQRLLNAVSPLTLTNPDAQEFRPANCRTLHDVARFVHQRAMAEMFATGGLSVRERRQTRRLSWRMPMEVLILDLGGGVAPDAPRSVSQQEIVSEPFLALLEGMTDPRLRWAGPVGFDLRGFMSVVVRSAADDQRYGEPSYVLCSRDYVHFSSRLAYHFATVEAVCGTLINENYSRFLFHGGAAVADRRGWRARFLATVLQYNGFVVKQTGDRVDAVFSKRKPDVVEDSLVMLGRLMVASRHLDMVMESPATADAFARAFLSGDFGFELVRKERG